MRKLAFLPLLFLFLGITACDGSENPVGPAGADQASVSGAETATAGPMSSATHGAKMVPYKATASFAPGTANLTLCFPDGSTTPITALPAFSVGEGQHTHLGRATTLIADDYCTAILDGSALVGLLAGGTFTHTGSNGDAITGVWDALFTPPTFEFVANDKAHPIVFLGGTGRFDGASGYAYGGGTIDGVTGVGTFSVQGEISSVGSLK